MQPTGEQKPVAGKLQPTGAQKEVAGVVGPSVNDEAAQLRDNMLAPLHGGRALPGYAYAQRAYQDAARNIGSTTALLLSYDDGETWATKELATEGARRGIAAIDNLLRLVDSAGLADKIQGLGPLAQYRESLKRKLNAGMPRGRT